MDPEEGCSGVCTPWIDFVPLARYPTQSSIYFGSAFSQTGAPSRMYLATYLKAGGPREGESRLGLPTMPSPILVLDKVNACEPLLLLEMTEATLVTAWGLECALE